ncbi:MAG: ThiF family adenylyltransferase [Candidatus Heimdallarchaeota archaeon]
MPGKLTPRELDRFSRQIALHNFSVEAQEQLKEAKVAIVGVGGLGANSVLQLAAMGVGSFRLIDRDVVERSNLPRTPLFYPRDLEKSKAEAAGYRLKKINPKVDVEIHATEFDRKNARRLLEGVDVVVDGLDRFAPRMLINTTCKELSIPFVFAGVVGTAANLSTFIYEEGPCLSCIFGEVDDAELPTCETVGVHTTAVIIAAAIQASETVRLLTRQPPVLKGELLYIDLETLAFDRISIIRRKDCPICSSTSKAQPVEQQKVVELCGKDSYIVPSPGNIRIDINRAKEVLEQKFTISTAGDFALTFQQDDVKISLMAGGNALIKGVKAAEDAKIVYDEIIELISAHIRQST